MKENGISDADHELGVDCFNHDVVFSLSAEDETSKVDSRAYVLATKAMTASQLKSASWVTLAEGDTVTLAGRENVFSMPV